VNPQPRILNQIFRVPAADYLGHEKAVQQWAHAIDQERGRVRVGALIPRHELFEAFGFSIH
jgi:hypothetical protein